MMDLISRDAAIAAIEVAKRDFTQAEFVTKDFVICDSAYIGLSRAVLEVSALPSPWVSSTETALFARFAPDGYTDTPARRNVQITAFTARIGDAPQDR